MMMDLHQKMIQNVLDWYNACRIYIHRIIMGMTGMVKKREWKIRLNASNSNPSTDILFDIENANTFLISLDKYW